MRWVETVNAVDRELVYNNMAEAFFRFKKSLFNPNHRSDYSSVDTEVLTKFRTVVPLGELFKGLDKMDATKQEIDICKAFTKAFSSISHIPVFDQFDNWKVFNPKCKIRDLNLYVTKGSSRGATLSFTLRSQGEGGQPRYLILQEIASHFSKPPPPCFCFDLIPT